MTGEKIPALVKIFCQQVFDIKLLFNKLGTADFVTVAVYIEGLSREIFQRNCFISRADLEINLGLRFI